MIIFQETSKLEGFAVGMWVGRYVGRGFALVAWWWVAGLVYMLVGLSPEMSFVGTCCNRTDAILATMVAVHAVFVRLEPVQVISLDWDCSSNCKGGGRVYCVSCSSWSVISSICSLGALLPSVEALTETLARPFCISLLVIRSENLSVMACSYIVY